MGGTYCPCILNLDVGRHMGPKKTLSLICDVNTYIPITLCKVLRRLFGYDKDFGHHIRDKFLGESGHKAPNQHLSHVRICLRVYI